MEAWREIEEFDDYLDSIHDASIGFFQRFFTCGDVDLEGDFSKDFFETIGTVFSSDAWFIDFVATC